MWRQSADLCQTFSFNQLHMKVKTEVSEEGKEKKKQKKTSKLVICQKGKHTLRAAPDPAHNCVNMSTQH